MPSLFAPTGSDAERQGASSQRAYRNTRADFEGYMQGHPGLSGEQAYAQWHAQRPMYGNINSPFVGPAWDARIPGHGGKYEGQQVQYRYPGYAPGATVPWGVAPGPFDYTGSQWAGTPQAGQKWGQTGYGPNGPPQGQAPAPGGGGSPGGGGAPGGSPGGTPSPGGNGLTAPRAYNPAWDQVSQNGPDQNWDWNASANPQLYNQANQWAHNEMLKNVMRGQLSGNNYAMDMLSQARAARGMNPLVGGGYGMGLQDIYTRNVQPWRVGDTSMGQPGANQQYNPSAVAQQRYQMLTGRPY